MTALIIIWAVLLLTIILVYTHPGYRNSREMVKIDPAPPRVQGSTPKVESTDQAA